MSVTVCVTGAAGQIAYSLYPHLCSGATFGPDVKVKLRLLDIAPMQEALGGVHLELIDGAFPLLEEVITTADVQTAFTGIDYCVMLGAFPRRERMERKDLLKANAAIFKDQGKALNTYANKTVKVLVVGNPANTNCLIASTCAPDIPKTQFSALTRLDHNRAKAIVAQRVGVECDKVNNVVIWGNHSSTQFPDVGNGSVDGKPVRAVVNDDAWLNGEFINVVQTRGAAIIKARKLSSALSAAIAIRDHIRDWVHGTAPGTYVSMAVASDGSYAIPEGVVYSFPVTCQNGAYAIVQGLSICDFAREKMRATLAELQAEKEDAFTFLT